jgi:hypothetical protein
MRHFVDTHSHTIANGATGVVASATGFMVTFVEAIEAWVRLSTAIVLLIVALISLRNLVQSGRSKNKKQNKLT